jgi:hypothetical protein
MPLKCTPVQQLYISVLDAFNKRLLDNENISYFITDRGYKFTSDLDRRFISVSPATKSGHVVFEFGDSEVSWVHNVLCVWGIDTTAESIASRMHSWFFQDDGFMFNVPVNGELPAHSVSRLKGMHSRGPVKGSM